MKKIIGVLAFVFTVKFFVGYNCVYAQEDGFVWRAKYMLVCDITNGYNESRCTKHFYTNYFYFYRDKYIEYNPVEDDYIIYKVIDIQQKDGMLFVETKTEDGLHYMFIFIKGENGFSILVGLPNREYDYSNVIYIYGE
ncbi:MAG: hypothetical protein KatS3mg083_266 [Candidatus Dojkabacteria bacterium]|nr:MAG: hypothetical protein KatS3mg083_266 [Candidatus Dojkabacteria bacterium]